jgi:hypothetical protein
MRIRKIVRDIIISHFLNKHFNMQDIITYIEEHQLDVSSDQLRSAVSGLTKYGDLSYVRKMPPRDSYYVTRPAIHGSRDMEKKKADQKTGDDKQTVYPNKYDQLIGNAQHIPAQSGVKSKGTNAPCGHIKRARKKVYVGCTMEII